MAVEDDADFRFKGRAALPAFFCDNPVARLLAGCVALQFQPI